MGAAIRDPPACRRADRPRKSCERPGRTAGVNVIIVTPAAGKPSVCGHSRSLCDGAVWRLPRRQPVQIRAHFRRGWITFIRTSSARLGDDGVQLARERGIRPLAEVRRQFRIFAAVEAGPAVTIRSSRGEPRARPRRKRLQRTFVVTPVRPSDARAILAVPGRGTTPRCANGTGAHPSRSRQENMMKTDWGVNITPAERLARVVALGHYPPYQRLGRLPRSLRRTP